MKSLSSISLPRLLSAGIVAFALGVGVSSATGSYAGGDPVEDVKFNPCTEPGKEKLLCPDITMSKPSEMYIEKIGGRRKLRATSSVNSVGEGPMDLRGTRIPGTNTMSVVQRIHKRSGGTLHVKTNGKLGFYPIPGQYRYWKFRDAARFEIWSLDANDNPDHLLKVGPKFFYCFRDLFLTRPHLPKSPPNRVFPGCNQELGKPGVRLGTSIGWSDVYPATYYQQYIDVQGLRGCFGFYHVFDPKNHVRESSEDNNRSRVLIELPALRVVKTCRKQRGNPSAAGESGSADGTANPYEGVLGP